MHEFYLSIKLTTEHRFMVFFQQEPNLRSNYIWCSMNLKGILERMLEKIFCKTMVSLKWLKRSAMEARFILSDTIYGTYLRLTKCLCSRPSNGLFSHFCRKLFSFFEQGRVQKLVYPTKWPSLKKILTIVGTVWKAETPHLVM